jgi:CheY-like chemotaxis protein
MALRVLLADESTSIKKVMQLALQDFGVEVKAVPIGIDVLPVARSWTPDIVFVDVLLAKKSGYDVSLELKSDSQFAPVPVVLMWSGFMDIDEARAQASKANRRLEKPFDADALRGLVKELVPETKTNALSDYLTFPQRPEFIEPAAKAPGPHSSPQIFVQTPDTAPNPSPKATASAVQEIDEPEDFTQIPLPKTTTGMGTGAQSKSKWTEPNAWASDNLEQFKIQMPTDEYLGDADDDMELEAAPIEIIGQGEVPLADIGGTSVTIQLKNAPLKEKVAEKFASAMPAASSTAAVSAMDPVALEQLVREQARLMLKDIAWKIIPDMAERILREELQKLLKEAEKIS